MSDNIYKPDGVIGNYPMSIPTVPSKGDLVTSLIRQAQEIGACQRLVGNEGLEELANLLKSPQGAEFCIKNMFPAKSTWAELKQYAVDKYGVFINAGTTHFLTPEDPIALVGRTTAVVDIRGHELHTIIALRGACVTIDAYDWAVCRVWADRTCQIIKKPHGNAIII